MLFYSARVVHKRAPEDTVASDVAFYRLFLINSDNNELSLLQYSVFLIGFKLML